MIFITNAVFIAVILFEAVMPPVIHTTFIQVITRLKQESTPKTLWTGMPHIVRETLHPA